MPKRSEKRDTAKAEYIAKKKKGEEVSLRALEESDRRMALEKQRLEILRMRATGAVDVPDPDGTAADDLDAPLEEVTEE